MHFARTSIQTMDIAIVLGSENHSVVNTGVETVLPMSL